MTQNDLVYPDGHSNHERGEGLCHKSRSTGSERQAWVLISALHVLSVKPWGNNITSQGFFDLLIYKIGA